jgi:ABC-type nitrate/sulfonate/bicarbonate transport system ATPase subunit
VPHDVEQALFMANRVGVLSDCSIRIKTKVSKDLPHSDDPPLAKPRHQVLEMLGLDAN